MSKKERNGKYGIHMKQWCRQHEADMLAALEDLDTQTSAKAIALLEEHKEKIRWLQHERLVHLIVTVMVVFVELFCVYFAVLHPELGLLPPIIMLALAVLLGFYFYHYFFLENAVQRWYRIAEELQKQISLLNGQSEFEAYRNS